jgi:hypothetical protein
MVAVDNCLNISRPRYIAQTSCHQNANMMLACAYYCIRSCFQQLTKHETKLVRAFTFTVFPGLVFKITAIIDIDIVVYLTRCSQVYIIQFTHHTSSTVLVLLVRTYLNQDKLNASFANLFCSSVRRVKIE